ncbi:MAG: M64 family metallopeptidase [Fibrobacterales bacterium]
MTTLTFRLLFLLSATILFGANRVVQVDTLLWSGPPLSHIQLVITNDGYTAAETELFNKGINTPCQDLSHTSACGHARKAFDKLFSTSPFFEYQDFFNVIVITTESNESGIGMPGLTDLDSYYKIHRLFSGGAKHHNTTTMTTTIDQYAAEARGIFILSNEPGSNLGNASGIYTYQTTGLIWAPTFVHEAAHVLGGLSDTYAGSTNHDAANATPSSDPQSSPWKDWIGTEYSHFDSTYSIGMYPVENVQGNTFYTPCLFDYMTSIGQEIFCPVNQEAMIKRFNFNVFNHIDNATPAFGPVSISQYYTLFSIDAKVTYPTNTIKAIWTLNGNILPSNDHQLYISAGDLAIGQTNTLEVKAADSTSAIRTDYRWGQTYQWTLNYSGGLQKPENEPTVTWSPSSAQFERVFFKHTNPSSNDYDPFSSSSLPKLSSSEIINEQISSFDTSTFSSSSTLHESSESPGPTLPTPSSSTPYSSHISNGTSSSFLSSQSSSSSHIPQSSTSLIAQLNSSQLSQLKELYLSANAETSDETYSSWLQQIAENPPMDQLPEGSTNLDSLFAVYFKELSPITSQTSDHLTPITLIHGTRALHLLREGEHADHLQVYSIQGTYLGAVASMRLEALPEHTLYVIKRRAP